MASQIQGSDYKYERSRLDSFSTWPKPHLKVAALATAGFYFSGRDDHVICFTCGVMIGNWEQNDCIVTAHLKWKPSCNFVRGMPCGNVPLPRKKETTVCTETTPTKNNIQRPIGEFYPRYPYFETYASRLVSFDEVWAQLTLINTDALAKAGFFYCKDEMQTKCFSCGVKVYPWMAIDDPCQLHFQLRPMCRYLNMSSMPDTFKHGSTEISNNDPPQAEALVGPRYQTPSVSHNSIASIGHTQETISAQIDDCIPRPNHMENALRETVEMLNGLHYQQTTTPQCSNESESQSHVEEHHTPTVASLSSEAAVEPPTALCIYCLERAIDIITLPCLHANSCSKCQPAATTCSECQVKIDYTLQITPMETN